MNKVIKYAITGLLTGIFTFSFVACSNVFGGEYKVANEEERKAAIERIAKAADREERQFDEGKAPEDQRNKQMDFNVSFKRGREFWCWTRIRIRFQRRRSSGNGPPCMTGIWTATRFGCSAI